MSQVLFTQAQQPTGPLTNFLSPTFTVPAGTEQLQMLTTMLLADIQDPTNSIEIDIVTLDGVVQGGETWHGGLLNKSGSLSTTSPGFLFDVGDLVGKTIRAKLTLSKQINVGVTVTSLP